ncbi:DUF2141 domain-containing protein [candidate division KSB1 bacterium]|nr:DUF2141 domain-containing protein [candidate division KSB1 bacterium]
MKSIRLLIFLSIFLLLPMLCFSQDSTSTLPQTGTLIVLIENLKSNDGNVLLSVFPSESSWNGKGNVFANVSMPITENKATTVFESVPFGEYAIKFFHDANNDDELNMNFIKMPKESFGFSNHPKIRFKPPDWEKAKFNFHTDTLKMTMQPY